MLKLYLLYSNRENLWDSDFFQVYVSPRIYLLYSEQLINM